MGLLHTRITNPRPTGCSYGWYPNGLHLRGYQSVDVDFDPFTTIPTNSGYLQMLIQQLRQGLVKFEYWVEAPCTTISNPNAPTTVPPPPKKIVPPAAMPEVKVGAPQGVVPKPPVVEIPTPPVKPAPVEKPLVNTPPIPVPAPAPTPIPAPAPAVEKMAVPEVKEPVASPATPEAFEVADEWKDLTTTRKRRRRSKKDTKVATNPLNDGNNEG